MAISNICMSKQKGKKTSKRGGAGKSSALQLADPADNEYYAIVTAAKGNCIMEVEIHNGPIVYASIKGSMRGGRGFEKINVGDYVRIQKDETTTSKDKHFITHKYSSGETKKLRSLGELKKIASNTAEETSSFQFESDVAEVTMKEEVVDDNFINDI